MDDLDLTQSWSVEELWMSGVENEHQGCLQGSLRVPEEPGRISGKLKNRDD